MIDAESGIHGGSGSTGDDDEETAYWLVGLIKKHHNRDEERFKLAADDLIDRAAFFWDRSDPVVNGTSWLGSDGLQGAMLNLLSQAKRYRDSGNAKKGSA